MERAHAWIALIGVWIGLAAAGLYFNSVDTAVRNFKGRIIGQAVVFGLDPALRIRAYVIICAVALGAAALVIIALYSLQAWTAARRHALLSRGERRGAALLALAGSGDLILHLLTGQDPYRIGSQFLLLCTLLLTAAPIARLFAWRSNRFSGFAWMRALGSPLTQGAIVLLAYQLSVGVGVLMDLPLMLGPAALGRFLFAWLLLQAVVSTVTVRHGNSLDAGPAGWRLMCAGLPLLWLPAVGPLANELQYTLRAHLSWTPQLLAGLMALGLVALAAGIWLRTPPRPLSARSALRMLRRWYIPVVLVSSALLTLHRHTMTIDAVDVYHHGEMTTPVMEILQKGRIPFLEICLPHGLMDIVPQALFGILNGADRWDILIWGSGHWPGWLTITAGLALVYALLAGMASPLAALLVLFFLPAELLLPFQYAPLVLCVLALQVFLKNRGTHRVWLLPASVFAVLLWRIDFGLAAIVASAAVLATVAWSCRRVRWTPLLRITSVILVGTGTVVAALATLRGSALGGVIHTYVTYVSMQVTVASYFQVYDTMSPLVVLQYMLLPAIGLLIVLHGGVRALLLRQCAAARVHSLVLLAVLSLVLFVRSLQRHSLFEGVFSPHLFLFLLAAMPALLRPPRRALVSALLVVVSVGAAFVLPETRSLARDVKWPAIVGGPPRYDFRTWVSTDQRVLVPDPLTDDVVRLLRAQLQPGQTFYDFSNAPLLYFLTGAAPPTYIIEPSYYAADDLQQAAIRDLDALRRADRLPLVVFKQHTAFDAIDGIPNEMRSYRIVEYLYAHYVPWANAGRFELWIDKRLGAAGLPLEAGMEGPVVVRYPLPLHTPASSANVNVRTTETAGLALTGSGEPAWVDGLFTLPKEVVWGAGAEYHLHLRCTTSATGPLQAIFSFAGAAGATSNSAEVIVAPTADDQPQDVRLPLRLGSAQPPALMGIRLVLPRAATLTIETAELEVRQRPVEATPAWAWSPVGAPYIQQFDLYRLPYIWANFDDRDPVHTGSTLQVLHAGAPVDVTAEQAQAFAVQPAGMQAPQYLHLRLQADSPATVTVAYGDATHPSTLSMLVQGSPEPQDHLIRISTQWEWFHGPVTALNLSSTDPVHLHALRLLAGD